MSAMLCPRSRARSGLLPWVLAPSLLVAVGADAARAQTQVVVDDSKVASAGFIGFGAEWDAAGYTQSGVTDQDYQVIEKRIRWMRLPVVRKAMLTRWALIADGVFDFETQEMRDLYRQLDICQREGITVFLTDWGCERSWNAAPGVQDVSDPKYAKAIGTYLDHLINKRGYTSIKYLIVVNEPNFETRDFEDWKTALQNVRAELASRHLDRAVTLAGPDHSYAEGWLYRSVDQLAGALGAYEVHRYADDASVRSRGLESYFLDQLGLCEREGPERRRQAVRGGRGRHERRLAPAAGQRQHHRLLLWAVDGGLRCPGGS